MSELKDCAMIVMMEPTEKERIKTVAKSYGMGLSDFVRMTVKLGETKLIELDSSSKIGAIGKAVNVIK